MKRRDKLIKELVTIIESDVTTADITYMINSLKRRVVASSVVSMKQIEESEE